MNMLDVFLLGVAWERDRADKELTEKLQKLVVEFREADIALNKILTSWEYTSWT